MSAQLYFGTVMHSRLRPRRHRFVYRVFFLRLRIDATIPDLSAVKARGGKVLQYHGWSDPGVSPEMSINYYQAVKKIAGAKETDDFYRLFLVPGMGHCQGGAAACSNVDWLGAI